MRSKTEIGAVRVAIALERSRLAEGAWPASLDALVPAYLDSIPVDPFTDGPLRYALGEGGPVVYSVGMDREDDGGRASPKAWRFVSVDHVEDYLKNDVEAFGGDWVLFPKPAEEGE
ncbi:MAG TPA: hypothetical protein ENK11_03570 [Phycisphaerales bacterium]|nr:hypothetical protein [Phycisphaerales bacterium]